MTAILTDDWGPYSGPADATARLSAFVDRACGSDVGIAWCSQGAIHPLRAPRRDGDGVGGIAMFEWWAAPPPPPKPPSGWQAKLRAWLNAYFEAQGRAAIAQGQANMVMGQAIAQGVDKLFRGHADDAAGVAIDIIGIVVFILLIPSGVSEIAFAGAVGGGLLLYRRQGVRHGDGW